MVSEGIDWSLEKRHEWTHQRRDRSEETGNYGGCHGGHVDGWNGETGVEQCKMLAALAEEP